MWISKKSESHKDKRSIADCSEATMCFIMSRDHQLLLSGRRRKKNHYAQFRLGAKLTILRLKGWKSLRLQHIWAATAGCDVGQRDWCVRVYYFLTVQAFTHAFTSVCPSLQEHSGENGGGSQVLSDCEDFKQEQSRISRLERQAQDFLNAVFHRKGNTKTHTHTHTHTLHQSLHFSFHIASGRRYLEYLSMSRGVFQKIWLILQGNQ